MLKWFLPIFAVVLIAAISVPVMGRSSQQGSPAPAMAPSVPAEAPTQAGAKNPVKPTPASQAQAKSVFQIDCSMCHGDNGNGKSDLAKSMNLTMDDWTNPAALANKTDSELFNTIRNGKGEGDKMPPESAGRATDTQVWTLVIYIRSFSKP